MLDMSSTFDLPQQKGSKSQRPFLQKNQKIGVGLHRINVLILSSFAVQFIFFDTNKLYASSQVPSYLKTYVIIVF